MEAKKFDVVRLKDGREGTIADVYRHPTTYLVETNEDDVSSWPTVTPDEIIEIIEEFNLNEDY